ncbi:MAG: DNA polymerase IV [Desulfobacteraceae bacterium]|nr:DNA polymerase IV [Desulfobacteraceae bacterium]
MIVHVDMDAFFASVEKLDNPELADKCVIVGGISDRGVVSAASYEARKFGVCSAMPMYRARQLCPRGVFLAPRGSRYKEISRVVMDILGSFSPLVEQVSIDEAYLDISGCEHLFGTPRDIGGRIKEKIREQTGLTCSVGMAPYKFLAKIASDMEKPDGLVVISPDEAAGFIESLPVDKVPGVGLVSGMALSRMGITTLGDVKKYGETVLVRRLGKFGTRLFELASGIDRSSVAPTRPVKSVSSEKTLAADTRDKEYLKTYLLEQAEDVGTQLRQKNLRAKTVFIKIKLSDFTQVTRQASLEYMSHSAEMLYTAASGLLEAYHPDRPVRLIGLGATDLIDSQTPVQQDLFSDSSRRWEKWEKVESALDAIRRKYGKQGIARAGGWKDKDRPPGKDKK